MNDNKLTLQEKTLYHQIHPLKLLTDIGMTFPALVLFWQHQFLLGLLVNFIPSMIVTAILVRYADLERYKQSAFGRYIQHYMTNTVMAVRFGGLAVMCIGAWFHIVWLMPLGGMIIILAWLRGVLLPDSEHPTHPKSL